MEFRISQFCLRLPVKSTTIITTLLFLFVSISFSAPLSVAVNDLTGTGVAAEELTIISQRLRSELIKTRSFHVMERAEMVSILAEQGFQQSGACDESSCMVEVGKILGVRQIIAGSVGKVGANFYTISLRMIDVETGVISKTSDCDYTGSISGLISQGIAQAATELARVSTQPDSPFVAENKTVPPVSSSEAISVGKGDILLGASASSTWFYGMQSDPGFLNSDMGGGVTVSMAINPFVDFISAGVDLGMMWSDEKHNQAWDNPKWLKKSSKTQIGFTVDFHPFGVPSVVSKRTVPRKTDLYMGTRFGPNYYESTYEYITEGVDSNDMNSDTTHSDFFVDGHVGLNIMVFKNLGIKVEIGSDRVQWIGVVARIPTRKIRGKV